MSSLFVSDPEGYKKYFPILSVIILALIIIAFIGGFKYRPSQAELVGEYEIVEVTGLNFDKNSYRNYKLTFNSDSTFMLTPTPYINICEKGRYEVDYSFEFNELTIQCGGAFTTGHINSGFGNLKIEFMVGDPDSRNSVFFKKKTRSP